MRRQSTKFEASGAYQVWKDLKAKLEEKGDFEQIEMIKTNAPFLTCQYTAVEYV